MMNPHHTRVHSNSYSTLLSQSQQFVHSQLNDHSELPDDDDSDLDSDSDADSSVPTKKKPEKAKWTVDEVMKCLIS